MADNNSAMLAMMMSGMYGPNPYSQFQGRIPMPGYAGTPTDAMGNPIQPPTPGTTLNSTPAPAAPSQPSPSLQQYQLGTLMGLQGGLQPNAQNYRALTGPTMIPGVAGPSAAQQAQFSSRWAPPGAAPAAQAGPAAQAAGAAPDSLQQAISLLGHPGPVTTPGATVPQSQVNQQPSVLQQFLANQKGGTGAGNYSNQGFFDTLNRLGAR